MSMTYDERQTVARLSLWNGQHGQEIRMAETLPDDEEDEDDIEDEDNEEDIDEEDDEGEGMSPSRISGCRLVPHVAR